MLIKIEDSLSEVLRTVKHEIRRGSLDRNHPFRLVVLSTYGAAIASRYVVLRMVDESFRLIIYTDSRSAKMEDIQQNAKVQLLFYHPQKQAQVNVSGNAVIASQDELTKHHWKKIVGNSERSYTTDKPPGSPIKNPQQGHIWDTSIADKYFATITITPTQIEILQLNQSKHLRVRFSESNDWSGIWLVP